MKNYLGLLLFALIASWGCANANAQQNKGKVLVTYFSVPETDELDASTGASRLVVDDKLYGTTEYVAKQIAEMTGADLFEIKTTNSYPTGNHKTLIDYAKKEEESKSYPKIASKIDNFNDYNVIFVGYPNWWYDMPRVIYSLLKDYDFSGKTIVPFCTHGGSGFSQSVKTIQSLEKDAKVISIPAISRQQADKSQSGLKKWLTENGFAK